MSSEISIGSAVLTTSSCYFKVAMARAVNFLLVPATVLAVPVSNLAISCTEKMFEHFETERSAAKNGSRAPISSVHT